jgi:hypothetical protein
MIYVEPPVLFDTKRVNVAGPVKELKANWQIARSAVPAKSGVCPVASGRQADETTLRLQ